MLTQVAQHLKITESAIIKIEKWTNVLFVVAKGLGARFVSKKIMDKKLPALTGTEKQVAWAKDIRKNSVRRIERYAKYFADRYDSKVKDQVYNLVLPYMQEIATNQTEAKWWIENRSKNTGLVNFCDLLTVLSLERRKHSEFLNQTLANYKKHLVAIF